MEKNQQMCFEVESGKVQIRVTLASENGKLVNASVENKKYALHFARIQPDHLVLRLDNKNFDVLIAKDENKRLININGKPVELVVFDARMRKLQQLSKTDIARKSAEEIKAPMPGLVLRVLAKEGDKVEANDGLIVIEAMKMENEIRAPTKGIVKRIHVKEGQAVDKGSLLLRLGGVKK
jgi:pyruvate carboxylase subunit B